MRNLREGVDMVTVCEEMVNLHITDTDLTLQYMGIYTWETVIPKMDTPAHDNLGLFITSVLHKKQSARPTAGLWGQIMLTVEVRKFSAVLCI